MHESSSSIEPEPISAIRHGGLILCYLILTCLMTFPVCLRLVDHVPGAGDPLLTCWYLDRNMDWFSGGEEGPFYDSQLLYPYPATAAYSEHFIGTSFLALPLRFVGGGNPVLVYNLIFLGGFLFSAYGAHLLAYEWCRRHIAGVTAALVFAFVPFRIDHIVHLHMVTAAWVPFTLLFLSRYLRSPGRMNLAGFGICFLMNALSSCFYMVALSLILLIVFPFMAWSARSRWKRMVYELGPVLLLTGVVILMVYKPYLEVQGSMGFERDVRENVLYSARLQSWLAVPGWQANSLLYGKGGLNFEKYMSPECALFPGFLALFGSLAVLGICLRERRLPGWLAAMFALSIIGWILSFGPWFNRDPEYPNYLFQAVFSFFPGASSMRTPARYAFFVYTGIAIISAYAAVRITQRLPTRFRALAWGYPVLVLIEYVAVPLHTEALPDPREIPAHVDVMKKDHSDPVFIEYPLGSDVLNREVTFAAISHDLFTVNGYTSYYPPAHHRLRESGIEVMSEDRLKLLEVLGVTHLVADRVFLSSRQRNQLETFSGEHPDRLRHIAREGKKEIYRLPQASPSRTLHERVDATLKVCEADLPSIIPAEGGRCAGRLRFPGAYPALVDALVIPLNREGLLRFRNEDGKSVSRTRISLQAERHEAAAFVLFSPPGKPGLYTASIELNNRTVFVEQNVRVLPSFPDIRESVAVIESRAKSVSSGPNEVVLIPLTIRNDGETYWRSHVNEETGEVRVGYRIRQNGGVLKEMRARLPRDVAPGEKLDVVLEFRASPVAGEYDLSISLLAEKVTWFEAEGNMPLVIPLTVK